ncbi:MAG: glycosyltransferase family 2 protein [Flavobacteriales bacterium]|nr:glycosyltransferase family 2 protein [Flavobacteriales bacterium]
MKVTAVVILNWNGAALLRRFLPSVIEHSRHEATIWVVDNASTDESIKILKNEFPEVQILQLDKNYGFAGGYNRALKEISADYYVLLNSDVEVTPGWLSPILRQFEKQPNLGACQPIIRSWQHKEAFEYAGAAGGFIDYLGYPFCRGRIFDTLEFDEGQYNTPLEIFWATGAAFFVRSEVYHACGGFDEEFFAHMEEIDLCWRMKNRGWKILCEPKSIVYHVGGGTLNQLSPRKTFLNFRNNLNLLLKNLPGNRLIPILFLRMVLDGIAALAFLFQSNGHLHFWAVLKAHLHFYKGIIIHFKKRKEAKPNWVSQIYQRSILWDYHLKKRNKFSQLPLHYFSS